MLYRLGSIVFPEGNFFIPIIKWLFNSIGDYGLTIIVFTILVRAAFIPLDFVNKYFAKKKTVEMQKVKPEHDKLAKLYKDDPLTLQREKAKVNRKYGIKQSGLQTLFTLASTILTFIVFISAFNGLNAISDANKSNALRFLWMKDIWKTDYILPLIAGVVSWGSAKINAMISNKTKIKFNLKEQEAEPQYSVRATREATIENLPLVNMEQIGKVMQFVLPIIMVVFAYISTAAFAVYLIASSFATTVFAFILNFFIDIIVGKQVKKQESAKPKEIVINPRTKYFKNK